METKKMDIYREYCRTRNKVKNHDFFYLNQIYRLTFCNLKSQKSTILTGFLIEACLLINIRDKNAKKN